LGFRIADCGLDTDLDLIMKPRPEPVDPARLHQLAHAVIREAKFPMLATVDPEGHPRVRPVSPVRVDVDFTVYVANLAVYQKTAEIAANPRVELAYLSPSHDQVRISGVAARETDPAVVAAIWERNPLLRQYLGTPENPQFILYRIDPERVRFMREWALEYHEVPRAEPPAKPS
jgi:general stress protein 26